MLSLRAVLISFIQAADKQKEARDELTLQSEQFRREMAAKDSLNELLKVRRSRSDHTGAVR